MLRDIRKQYEFSALNEENIHSNPLDQFRIWMQEAIESEQLEPTAMVLSTVDNRLQVHSRVVLLKEFSPIGFTFYTNYTGHKAQQIEQNNKVALVFFWPTLERQIRIEGVVEKNDEKSSDDYFNTRPLDSQLGAWASPQSKVIPSHEFLEEQFQAYQSKFGNDVPKPPHWGGFIVKPNAFEFWQGRSNRLHDRLFYHLNKGAWTISRLAP